ncbi:hypothetical protein ACHAWF_002739 [Thalassiosira exigua]
MGTTLALPYLITPVAVMFKAPPPRRRRRLFGSTLRYFPIAAAAAAATNLIASMCMLNHKTIPHHDGATETAPFLDHRDESPVESSTPASMSFPIEQEDVVSTLNLASLYPPTAMREPEPIEHGTDESLASGWPWWKPWGLSRQQSGGTKLEMHNDRNATTEGGAASSPPKVVELIDRTNELEKPFDGCFVTAVFGITVEQTDRIADVRSSRAKYPNYEFIMFTNLVDLNAESAGWRKVMHFVNGKKRMITQSRHPKFLAWKEDFVRSYCPVVFYLDGTSSPKGTIGQFNQLKESILRSKDGLAQRIHNRRLEQEFSKIIEHGKDTNAHVDATRAWIHSQPDFASFGKNGLLFLGTYFGESEFPPFANCFKLLLLLAHLPVQLNYLRPQVTARIPRRIKVLLNTFGTFIQRRSCRGAISPFGDTRCTTPAWRQYHMT